MSVKKPTTPSKILKLSEVRFYPRNYAGACITVSYEGYVGHVKLAGADLIGDISTYQIRNSRPACLMLAESETTPGDVVCIPTMKKSDDFLVLEWAPKARTAKVNLARLLALKEKAIPNRTTLVIDLYHDENSEYGPVIGMGLSKAQYRPVQSKKAQKSRPEESAGPGTPT